MIPKPLQLAHDLVRQTLREGERALDATLGNGHDALFLAKLVGSAGLVIGIDIQQSAIDSSVSKMEENAISWYEFHCCSHELLEEKTSPGLGAVMFNLGYLPGADKSIVTSGRTTILALGAALKQLRPEGIMTVMCYPGHEEGAVEAGAVEEWLSRLERKHWRVFSYKMLNGVNAPPFLVVVQKV